MKPQPSPQPPKPIPRFVAWGAILLGAVAIGSGLWALPQIVQSAHWPTTDGVITRATISHFRPKDASISYNYQVAGIRYTGTRLALGEDMSNGGWILDRYPVGKTVRVHYSPTAPQLAVLETGIHGGTWTNLGVGTLFVLVGWMFLQFREVNSGTQKVKLQQPPILFGVIFIAMGAFVIIWAEPSGGPLNWVAAVPGGVFISIGLFLLAYSLRARLRQKSSGPPAS